MEDKIKELLHAYKHKEKKNHMNTTCKNSGTQSKTPKLRFHKMDKGDEI
jgi:hypothetical protein